MSNASGTVVRRLTLWQCGLEYGLRMYPIHGLIGRIYHNTFEICLKGVDNGGYKVLKKEKCLFV